MKVICKKMEYSISQNWCSISVQINNYRQKKNAIFKMQWNIENIVMITIKHLQMNRILALNNP